MNIASVAQVKARLSAYLRDSERGPVIVTRNGRPVAVLLAVADEEDLERLVMGYSPKLRALFDAARLRIREGGGLAHEELWSELESESNGAGAGGGAV